MSEYSVEEVREFAKRGDDFRPGHTRADLAKAYADLREQIDRAREGVTAQLADDLQAIIDGERPRLNNTEMRDYVRDLRLAHLLPSGERGGVDESAIERLRNALKMHNEHRTTMQSLASSVGDFLREAALAQPAQVAGVEYQERWLIDGEWCDWYSISKSAYDMEIASPSPECQVRIRPTAEPVAQGEAVILPHDYLCELQNLKNNLSEIGKKRWRAKDWDVSDQYVSANISHAAMVANWGIPVLDRVINWAYDQARKADAAQPHASPEQPAGLGIACTVMRTELHSALIADGMNPTTRLGNATCAWVSKLARDYLSLALEQPAGRQGEAWRACYGDIIKSLAAMARVGAPDSWPEDAIRRDPIMDGVRRIKQALDTFNKAKPFTHPAAPVGVPEGMVLVPAKFGIKADAWESAQFVFGGPGTGEGESFIDCTAWIGEVVDEDDGTKTHGLHVSCNECPEEGSITLAKFAAAPSAPQEKKVCIRNCDCVGPCKMGTSDGDDA